MHQDTSKQSVESLCNLIRSKDFNGVKSFIDGHPNFDFNTVSKNGSYSPLITAGRGGNKDMIDLVLSQKGVDINLMMPRDNSTFLSHLIDCSCNTSLIEHILTNYFHLIDFDHQGEFHYRYSTPGETAALDRYIRAFRHHISSIANSMLKLEDVLPLELNNIIVSYILGGDNNIALLCCIARVCHNTELSVQNQDSLSTLHQPYLLEEPMRKDARPEEKCDGSANDAQEECQLTSSRKPRKFIK